MVPGQVGVRRAAGGAAIGGVAQRKVLDHPGLWPEDIFGHSRQIRQMRLALFRSRVGHDLKWWHLVAIVRIVLPLGLEAEGALVLHVGDGSSLPREPFVCVFTHTHISYI